MSRSTFRYVLNRAYQLGVAGYAEVRAMREEERGEVLNLRWHARWYPVSPYRAGLPREVVGAIERQCWSLSGQLVFPSLRCGVDLDLHGPGSDNDVGWKLAIPPVAIYAGASSRPLRKAVDWVLARIPGDMGCRYAGRELGVNVHGGSVYWKVLADDSGWTSGRPRWRDGSFNPLDYFLGKAVYASELVEGEDDVEFPMPEGVYHGRVEIRRDVWLRPRAWFWPQVVMRAHVEMREPIPFPGKGESSWNCDEDAAHGMTAPAATVPEAVGNMVRSVLRDRAKYGGRGWRPERGPHGRPSPVVELAAAPSVIASAPQPGQSTPGVSVVDGGDCGTSG